MAVSLRKYHTPMWYEYDFKRWKSTKSDAINKQVFYLLTEHARYSFLKKSDCGNLLDTRTGVDPVGVGVRTPTKIWLWGPLWFGLPRKFGMINNTGLP